MIHIILGIGVFEEEIRGLHAVVVTCLLQGSARPPMQRRFQWGGGEVCDLGKFAELFLGAVLGGIGVRLRHCSHPFWRGFILVIGKTSGRGARMLTGLLLLS